MSVKNIESFYPLSPMQQGMLFHSFMQPGSGVYVEQMVCTLRGKLDIQAFERAWQKVVERHDILRTAFSGESLKEPIQAVHKEVPLKIDLQDWTSISAEEQSTRLETYLQLDRDRGFNLSRPPLMRLALIRLEDNQRHYFVWSHHHILLDGWSIPVLMNEVFGFYHSFSNGHVFDLETPRPFRDYIAWLKRQDRSAAENYWREKLKGFFTPTPLTTERALPSFGETENHFAEVEVWLGGEDKKTLENLAHNLQVTLSTLVQAAWGLLLSRYSGEPDVVFGMTVSGRPTDLPDSETMVGLFINTLPVRVQTPPDLSVEEWLKGLQSNQVEMQAYEYSPLIDIHGWSEVPRDLPLFNTLMVFENYPVNAYLESQGGEGLAVENIESKEQTNFPLSLIAGAADEIMLKLIYSLERFDTPSMERMLGHLTRLLKGFAKNSAQPLREVPMLSEEELHQLLVEWNQARVDFPVAPNMVAHLERQVKKTPHNIAISFQDQRLTYQELNARANQLAHYLHNHQLEKETLIGISFERSIEMVVAMLGVIKAGCAFVPVDPAYPDERIQFMLTDSGAPILLTQQSLLGKLPTVQAEIICLDDPVQKEIFARQSVENLEIDISLDNLAYVIYTSGSTGTPKGALLHHRGMINMAYVHQSIYHIREESKYLQFSSISFDASLAEIFPTLITGAELCMVKQETLLSPDEFITMCRERKVTTICSSPSFLSNLNPEDFPTLETVASAGEACPVNLAQKWYQKVNFVNAYGPTETSVGAASYQVNTLDEQSNFIPIGRSFPNVRLYILDPQKNPVPIGVPGELYIGGVGVGRGYLNRPELTIERFMPDPFSSEPNARVYKTGDLVKYLPDGNIVFLGRIDHQVKIRGFRIELGEVEAILQQHPSIKLGVVSAQGSGANNTQLAAYIVPNDPAGYDSGVLREYLHSKLPAYMVPNVFITLEALPTLPNGKVNRKALPALNTSRPQLKQNYIAPRDTVELILTQIWEDVFEISPIGINDNFFELGGHSLQALRIIALVQKKLKRKILLHNLFEEPTIEHLASVVREAQDDSTADSSSLVPINTRGSKPPIYFIHPSGGSVHWYADLSKALGSDQPFYGFQAKGLMDHQVLHTTIEEMAAHYVNILIEKQPQGPYNLGSWSMGVVIAFEMAWQLHALGHKVAFLALLDQGPFLPEKVPDDSAEYLYNVFKKNLKLSLDHMKTLEYSDQLYYVWNEARKANWIYPDFTFDQFSFFVHILKTHTLAFQDYIPKKYPGKVTLFRSKNEDHSYSNAWDLGWAEYAEGGVEVIEMPGDHISMIVSSGAKNLARKMKACMEKTQTPVA